jgi:hypothetical protein
VPTIVARTFIVGKIRPVSHRYFVVDLEAVGAFEFLNYAVFGNVICNLGRHFSVVVITDRIPLSTKQLVLRPGNPESHVAVTLPCERSDGEVNKNE